MDNVLRLIGRRDDEPIELLAVGKSDGFVRRNETVRFDSPRGAEDFVRQSEEHCRSILVRANRWKADSESGLQLITHRRVLEFDIDSHREWINATDTELAATLEAGQRLRTHLSRRLGAESVALGCSGNGTHVVIPLDDIPQCETSDALIRETILWFAERFNTAHAYLDPNAWFPMIAIPVYGTLKAKAATSDGRPVRRTWLECPESLRRISLAELEALAE